VDTVAVVTALKSFAFSATASRSSSTPTMHSCLLMDPSKTSVIMMTWPLLLPTPALLLDLAVP